MEKNEMNKMVAKLEEERASHIKKIDDLTLRELREKNRKCYVPRLRGKEELAGLVKVGKSWKGSGSANSYFMEPPIMKPKILDPWTASRV
jgi:hypothetical protein